MLKISRIIVYPTDACNLDCKYCFVKKDKKLFLKWNKSFENIINLLGNSKEKYKEVEFLGGEPLINFKFMKNLIEYGREKYPEINYVTYTNGLLLTRKICTFFIKNKVQINLSIDGTKKNHEKERIGEQNSHDKLIKNLNDYVKINNGIYPQGKMTISPYNIDSLFENILYLIKLGFKNIYFDIAKGEYWNKINYITFTYIFKKIFLLQKKLGHNIKIENIIEIENKFENNNIGKLGGCRLGESLTIGYDSKIYSCQTAIELENNIKKKFLLGDIDNIDNINIIKFKGWKYSDKYYKSKLTKISGFEERLCFTYKYQNINITKQNIDYRIKMEEYMLKYISEKNNIVL